MTHRARRNPYVDDLPLTEGTVESTAQATLAAVPSTFPRKQLTIPQARGVLDAWIRSVPGFERVYARKRPIVEYVFGGRVRFVAGARSLEYGGGKSVPMLDAANTVISWAAEQMGRRELDLGAQGWLNARHVAQGERRDTSTEKKRRETARKLSYDFVKWSDPSITESRRMFLGEAPSPTKSLVDQRFEAARKQAEADLLQRYSSWKEIEDARDRLAWSPDHPPYVLDNRQEFSTADGVSVVNKLGSGRPPGYSLRSLDGDSEAALILPINHGESPTVEGKGDPSTLLVAVRLLRALGYPRVNVIGKGGYGIPRERWADHALALGWPVFEKKDRGMIEFVLTTKKDKP